MSEPANEPGLRDNPSDSSRDTGSHKYLGHYDTRPRPNGDVYPDVHTLYPRSRRLLDPYASGGSVWVALDQVARGGGDGNGGRMSVNTSRVRGRGGASADLCQNGIGSGEGR